MSKQEALYETEQCFTYKGKKLKIRFMEEYFDAIPRPLDEEKKMLKEDIHNNGLQEKIKINAGGMVLDGHTRIEIGEELGWKKLNGDPITPKFEVMEFKTVDEEKEYVIKTNLIRRQLNTFQKVRIVSKLYENNPHSQREQNRYDVLMELNKGGKMTCRDIGEIIAMSGSNVLKILRGLKEDYCANYDVSKEKTSTAPVHLYHILPKGEEVLSKGRPSRITLKTLGKSIGVQRDYLSRAIFLLNEADEHMLQRLESGAIGIMNAYTLLTKPKNAKRINSYQYLKNESKVICPKCNQTSLKKEWKIS